MISHLVFESDLTPVNQMTNLDLGAVDPWISLDPVGRAERERDEDGDDDEGADGELAGQRALTVNVRVGQDVIKLVVVFEGGKDDSNGQVCFGLKSELNLSIR